MAYNNVFLIEDSEGRPVAYCDTYHKAVSKIHEVVARGEEYAFVNVWKNSLAYDDGRVPSKGWNWREFLMVEHLYVYKPNR